MQSCLLSIPVLKPRTMEMLDVCARRHRDCRSVRIPNTNVLQLLVNCNDNYTTRANEGRMTFCCPMEMILMFCFFGKVNDLNVPHLAKLLFSSSILTHL